MFDLEAQIKEWRAELARSGVNARGLVDELESHLRADFEEQKQSGLDASRAFAAAVQHLGPPGALRREFNKLAMKNWNRKLAFAAWTMFVVSFFLPAYDQMPGWACAISQRFFWDGVLQGKWACINYELLTLANLLMMASPFILFRFGNRPRVSKWFRGLNLIAVLLVWAFIGLLLTSANDRRNLKIGCFVWGLSFVALQVSTLRRPLLKKLIRPATAD